MGREWLELIGACSFLVAGAVVGALTAVEEHLVNPEVLVVAVAVVAAYKAVEAVVDAFGDDTEAFDAALGEVFRRISGLVALAAIGYAATQTLLDGSYWFTATLVVFCLVFTLCGSYRAAASQESREQ